MAEIKLSEETTPEEMASFVDEIHAEEVAKKQPKGDAQIVNEHAGNVRTSGDKSLEDSPVVPKAKAKSKAKAPKDDETAAEPVSEKPAKGETADRSWLDDDLRKEAAGYGIAEDDLADFQSRDDLQRVMRFIDKRALTVGQKALTEGEQPNEPVRDAQGRFTKGETETTKEPEKAADAAKTEPDAKAPSFEIGLSKDKYEDDLVDELTRMRDHYEARFAELESKTFEAEARAEEDRFDSAVDELDMPTLFGTTGSESKEELERRSELLLQCRALQQGLRQLTGNSPDLETLVLRQARAAYAEDFDKKTIKSRTIKIAKQSDKRQGGGATRPTDAPESAREWAARKFQEIAGA